MQTLLGAAVLAAIVYVVYRSGKRYGSRCGYFAGRRDGRRRAR